MTTKGLLVKTLHVTCDEVTENIVLRHRIWASGRDLVYIEIRTSDEFPLDVALTMDEAKALAQLLLDMTEQIEHPQQARADANTKLIADESEG